LAALARERNIALLDPNSGETTGHFASGAFLRLTRNRTPRLADVERARGAERRREALVCEASATLDSVAVRRASARLACGAISGGRAYRRNNTPKRKARKSAGFIKNPPN
jgi:hypothetical protein